LTAISTSSGSCSCGPGIYCCSRCAGTAISTCCDTVSASATVVTEAGSTDTAGTAGRVAAFTGHEDPLVSSIDPKIVEDRHITAIATRGFTTGSASATRRIAACATRAAVTAIAINRYRTARSADGSGCGRVTRSGCGCKLISGSCTALGVRRSSNRSRAPGGAVATRQNAVAANPASATKTISTGTAGTARRVATFRAHNNVLRARRDGIVTANPDIPSSATHGRTADAASAAGAGAAVAARTTVAGIAVDCHIAAITARSGSGCAGANGSANWANIDVGDGVSARGIRAGSGSGSSWIGFAYDARTGRRAPRTAIAARNDSIAASSAIATKSRTAIATSAASGVAARRLNLDTF
jgi:hypothetical protein